MDFRVGEDRFREYSALADTPANRKKLEKVLDKIESEIAAGTFVYANYFPGSKALKRQAKELVAGVAVSATAQAVAAVVAGQSDITVPAGPSFQSFANTWFDERSIEWRRSHIKSLLSTLNGRLIPHFGQKVVSSITKSDVLEFRATLAKVKGRGQQEGLSAKRINEIMGLLRQILNEAADRFQFTSPVLNIKKLKQRRTDVDPFSLVDVQRILATVRADFKNYFTVRFFSGMRTGEVHGLKWKYVDFDLRIIRVRETFVLGEDEYTKTDGSQRDIQMSQPVFDALKSQYEATGNLSEYVFCNLVGQPLDNKNFSDRVWYPLLRHLGLKARRPYQMRHTAATLWLASGEAPEWIARQLGHTSTEMLFRVYSRYVPNLTRQDGSAMERLLASQMSQGALIEIPVEKGADLKDSHEAAQASGKAGQAGQAKTTYVPAQYTAPMHTPKPRGLHGRAMAPKSGEVIKPIETGGGSAPAQPPPTEPSLTWADLAQSWLGESTQAAKH
jgi:integrase